MKIIFQIVLHEVLKSGSCFFLEEVPSKHGIKWKQTCIYYLILLGIPSSLIFPFRTGCGGEGYLMDKIC